MKTRGKHKLPSERTTNEQKGADYVQGNGTVKEFQEKTIKQQRLTS